MNTVMTTITIAAPLTGAAIAGTVILLRRRPAPSEVHEGATETSPLIRDAQPAVEETRVVDASQIDLLKTQRFSWGESLDWAIDTGQSHGIWGSRTPQERRAIRRQRLREGTCAHVWPDELDPDTECTGCGLVYGGWSQDEPEVAA